MSRPILPAWGRTINPAGHFRPLRIGLGGWTGCGFALVFFLIACRVERRKSDAELGLTQEQSQGRKVYDAYCDRCHEPYSSSNKQGPSLKATFQKKYLEASGLPATEERVTEIILYGRSKMPGFGQTLSAAQVRELLAYLHTL